MILITLPVEATRGGRRSRKIFMRWAWLPAIGFLVACSRAGGVNGALAILTFHRGVANGALPAAHAQTPLEVMVAGVCGGVAWSAVVPVGIGLLFERSSKGMRGAAMGLCNLALRIGMTGGSLIAAAAAAWGRGYMLAMSLCAAASLVSLPWLFLTSSGRPPRRAELRLAGNQA